MGSIQSLDNIDPRIASELLYTGSNPGLDLYIRSPILLKCYFLYVPRNYYTLPKQTRSLNLIVLMHGSSRNPYTPPPSSDKGSEGLREGL